jgi:2-keto-3-deoxy-L-rhamnonate aldolase RhmA
LPGPLDGGARCERAGRSPEVMHAKPNLLKRALQRSQVQLGLWCSLASALSAEVVGGGGADWLLIDCEHSPNELGGVVAQLQAVAQFELEPLVRVPSDDRTLIKQFLDAGARSLMIPNVSTAAQAEALVAGMRYPPRGVRGFASRHRANGFGRDTQYAATAQEQQLLAVQIESPEAVTNAGAIAGVDGVDVVFVGPGDLAAHLGHLGEPHAESVQQAVRQVISAAKGSNKTAGIWAADPAEARSYMDLGFRMIAIGSDVGLLVSAADSLVRGFRVGAP